MMGSMLWRLSTGSTWLARLERRGVAEPDDAVEMLICGTLTGGAMLALARRDAAEPKPKASSSSSSSLLWEEVWHRRKC